MEPMHPSRKLISMSCSICGKMRSIGALQWYEPGEYWQFICAKCQEELLPENDQPRFVHIQPCANCGALTFSNRDMVRCGYADGRILPQRMTMGNQWMVVVVHGKEMQVCANCRYGELERW
jgi:hypothetical protein